MLADRLSRLGSVFCFPSATTACSRNRSKTSNVETVKWIYLLIILIIALLVTGGGAAVYLTYYWQQHYQYELNGLLEQVNDLSVQVDGLSALIAQLPTLQRPLQRPKRSDQPTVQHLYRWVNRAQRHVEKLSKYEELSDNPQWLISKIPLNVLQEHCLTLRKECLQGEPGPPGKPGPIGPPGIQGSTGQKGEPGLDGVDGLPGEPGLEGTPGIDGRKGEPGKDGISGKDGIDGKPGQKGEPGLNGVPGPPGSRGKRGLPGAEGKPGVAVSAWKHDNKTLLIAPTIDDMEDTPLVMTVMENENVRLSCVASGKPEPRITWRRDDNQAIHINGIANNLNENGRLNISRISRDNMGSYTCVATNGVPPAARKTIQLFVTFPPLVKILAARQIVLANRGLWTVLECFVEAYPEPFIHWMFGDSRIVPEGGKYSLSEQVLEHRLKHPFKRKVLLNITRVELADFGLYKCVARNRRGQTFGIIKLYDSNNETISREELLKESTAVVYGEIPKHVINETQCAPCPECVKTRYHSQCKRTKITDDGLSVHFHEAILQNLPKREQKCYLSQIGKAVLHGNYSDISIGCWMRDARPLKPEDEEKYWVTRTENNELLEEFDSKANFQNRLVTRNYTLLYRFSGNGQAIYSGSFYYAEEGTNKLIIFNLQTNDSAFLDLEPPRILPPPPVRKASRHVHRNRRRRTTGHRKLLYKNQLNRLDISADENGIWVVFPNLYGNSVNNTLVMRFNGTHILAVRNLTVGYDKIGETFIMCGVLYGVESLTQPSTNISFAYDLYENVHLDSGHFEQIQFTNPFTATVALSYNSQHRKLYSWDRGNMLEYLLKTDNKFTIKVDDEIED